MIRDFVLTSIGNLAHVLPRVLAHVASFAGEPITLKLFSRTQQEFVEITVEDSFPVDADGNLIVANPGT